MLSRKPLLVTVVLLIALLMSACAMPAAPADSGAASSNEAAPTAAPAEEAAPAAEAAAAEGGFTPSSPECIAPANPGGGWDFTCRAITKAMNDAGIVDAAFTVTNMAGGGGGVAMTYVVTEQNENNNLLIAASPATTLRIAQGEFGDLTEDDVRWLGALGADFAALTVAKDSPYQTLEDLMTALKADPASVNFGGGSAVGGQDHMKVMILAQSAGVDPLGLSYTAFDGGGEALTALLGGFIDVFPGDVSEIIGQVEADEVRVLAVLTKERLAAPFDQVPTAIESGYDAEWVVFRGFYVPAGISDEAYDWWVNALSETANSAEWEEARKQAGIAPYVLLGADFDTFVRNQVANFRQLSKDLGLIE
ncbi:MAG: tripartite tricarboxylate transporter substrate-binding protein [Caldilineaceae bacterium]